MPAHAGTIRRGAGVADGHIITVPRLLVYRYGSKVYLVGLVAFGKLLFIIEPY